MRSANELPADGSALQIGSARRVRGRQEQHEAKARGELEGKQRRFQTLPTGCAKASASDSSQERNAPDWQPFGYQDVSVTQENGRMWRDELSWRKFASRLFSSRSHLTFCGFATAHLTPPIARSIPY